MIIGGVIVAAIGLLFFLIYYLFGGDLPVISALPPLVPGVIIPLVFLLTGVMIAVVGLVLRSSSKR